MAAQFTPGPWRYGPATNYSGLYIAPGNRYPILAALHENGRCEAINFPGQTEANARLIAAAPELYEALEELLSATKEVGYVHYAPMRRKAEAVLAKARGETPSSLNLEGERG